MILSVALLLPLSAIWLLLMDARPGRDRRAFLLLCGKVGLGFAALAGLSTVAILVFDAQLGQTGWLIALLAPVAGACALTALIAASAVLVGRASYVGVILLVAPIPFLFRTS